MSYDQKLVNHIYRGVTGHIPMPRENRAAQFSPFAALTGYDETIREESRVTEERRYPEEGLLSELDETIRENPDSEMEITYFVPDRKKSGGEHVTVHGRIRRIMPESGILVLDNGSVIRLSAITGIRALKEK